MSGDDDDDSNWSTLDEYSHRNEGIHVVAGPGTGKSIHLGNCIAWRDAHKDMPVIIFDTGSTIDNLISRVLEIRDEQERRSISSRIRYINMASMPRTNGGYVYVGWPLYYRYGSESDDVVAARLVNAFRRLHPELERAQVQGMPRFEDVAMDVGIELVKKGLQLDSALAVLEGNPSIDKASAEAFRVRVKSLLRNPIQKDIYTASKPGVEWDEVFSEKRIVLLDFGGLTHESLTIKRFAIIWVLWDLLNFIDRRGANYTDPVSIIIDEFKALTTPGSFERQEVFAEDLDYILNTLMRQRNIWLTVAHQQMTQFSSRIRSLLMGMRTQIVGRPGTIEDAVIIARELYPLRTYWRKFDYGRDYSLYNADEQADLNAAKLMELEQFRFMVKNPGVNDGRITEIRSDPGEFPNKELIGKYKHTSMFLESTWKDPSPQDSSQAPGIAEEPSVTPVTKPLPIRTKGKLKS